MHFQFIIFSVYDKLISYVLMNPSYAEENLCVKTTRDWPAVNIILNSEKQNVLPLKSGIRQGCLLLPLLFNIGLEVLATAIREEKEIKGIQIGKEEVKLSLLADNMTLYINTIRKLLELISEFSKVTGYKINTQKSLAFLYTNNENSEREIKESISFTIVIKRVKYIRINLPKETKELYTENYKTLIKEIKDDINRWREIPCSWIGRVNTMKMILLSKAIHRFNAILIKLPMVVFTLLQEKKLYSVWKHKRPN